MVVPFRWWETHTNWCFRNTPRLGSSMLEGRPALQRKDWSTAPWLRNRGLASQVCRKVLTTMCGQTKKCLWFLRQHSSHLGGQGGFNFDSLYWQKCRLEGGWGAVMLMLVEVFDVSPSCWEELQDQVYRAWDAVSQAVYTCEWWLGHPDAS